MKSTRRALGGVVFVAALIGCGVDPASLDGSNLQATPQAEIVAEGWICSCTSDGYLSGYLYCPSALWYCQEHPTSPTGWTPVCEGGLSWPSDTDLSGQECHGTYYSGYPSACPDLPNTEETGALYCRRPLILDDGGEGDAD